MKIPLITIKSRFGNSVGRKAWARNLLRRVSS